MNKVAVVIHGQLRYWEYASKIFSYWPEAFKELNFDYFLATWEDEYSSSIESNIKFEEYALFTHYNMYKDMSPPYRYWFENIDQARGIPSYQHYYTFLLSKAVDLLKKKVQQGTNYDAVMLIRPDIFIFYYVFEFILEKMKLEVPHEPLNTIPFGDKMVYGLSGVTYSQNRLFCGKDTFFLGSVNSISSFGDIFYDIFTKSIFPPINLHSVQAEFLNWKRIYLQRQTAMDHKLIRTKENSKPGWPTPEGLSEVIDTFGPELYLKENNKEVCKIFLRNSNETFP